MIIEKLLKVALLGASWVMYLMMALSVVSIAAMVERWWFFFRRNVDVGELEDKLLLSLEQGDNAAAEKLLNDSKAKSFEAEAIAPALRYLDAGADAFADCVEGELIKLRLELERGTNLLGTLGNNAPFVGLLGTVIGVIISFHQLGSVQGAGGGMDGVMGGIAEALVSTAVGLFLALPAVIAYNVIQKKVGDIESNINAIAKQITALMKAREVRGAAPHSENSVMRPLSVVEGHG